MGEPMSKCSCADYRRIRAAVSCASCRSILEERVDEAPANFVERCKFWIVLETQDDHQRKHATKAEAENEAERLTTKEASRNKRFYVLEALTIWSAKIGVDSEPLSE